MVNHNNRAPQNYMGNNGCARNYSRSSCGCEQNARSANNCVDKQLMSRLQAVDFSLYDTVLYLDAYPNCQKAMAHYHQLLRERDSLLAKLSEAGVPINNMSNSSDRWNWIDSPWPWELEANT